MADLCNLPGIFCDPAGAPFGGAKLVLRPTSTQPTVTSEMIVAPVAVTGFETADDGAVALTLAPGRYRGTATQGAGGRSFSFDIAVPDLETAPLADYIGRIDVEVQTSAQKARDEAVAAAGAAGGHAADAGTQAGAAAADRGAVEALRDQVEVLASSGANAAAFYDTIAQGRAAVADGASFGVRAGGADGLTRPSVYRRDTSTSQTLIVQVSSGADIDGAYRRAVAAGVSGVLAGHLFARVPDPDDQPPGLVITGEDGSRLVEFDDLGNPVFAPLTAFERVGQPVRAGVTLVDDQGQPLASYDDRGNPYIAALPLFERVDEDFAGADLILVDDDGKRIDLTGRSPASDPLPDFAALSSALPSDEVDATALWRDGAHLAIRPALDPIYTTPRSAWFTNLATLYGRYDALMAEDPSYITKSSLGQDGLGNDIYQYVFAPPAPRLTAPATGSGLSASEAAPPKVILSSGLHGSERTAQMGTLIFATNLIRRWRDDPEYRRLRFGSQIVIIPAAVPSAVDAGTRPNHAGVDINRNGAWRWGEAGDLTPGTNFYMGPAAASEAETQILSALPITHPDAVGWVDHHNHAETQLVWIGCGAPAFQPAANRLAAALREDAYRLGIAPDLSADSQWSWLSKAIPGNIVGAVGASGLPAIFVEEPASAAHAALGGSTVALHRLSEAVAKRAVLALLDHHLN